MGRFLKRIVASVAMFCSAGCASRRLRAGMLLVLRLSPSRVPSLVDIYVLESVDHSWNLDQVHPELSLRSMLYDVASETISRMRSLTVIPLMTSAVGRSIARAGYRGSLQLLEEFVLLGHKPSLV